MDGYIVPSFQSRIVKAFLDIFKIISWDLYVPAIPCSVVGVLGPMMVFIPKAFGTLPVGMAQVVLLSCLYGFFDWLPVLFSVLKALFCKINSSAVDKCMK